MSNKYKTTLNIKPSLSSTKEFPNASKQWINSVYSFNSNYIKNIPSADNILNKILKSFFNLNPLKASYKNGKGKKSKLLKRRFRRLSLNKLFLSKSEIKHSNDKVHVTVYLFNKKKRSLLYKINKLFSYLSFKPSLAVSSDLETSKRSRLSSIKFKYFNSKSLNPGAKNNRAWIDSKRSLSVLNKLNTINKKYNGLTLNFLNKIHKKSLEFSSLKLLNKSLRSSYVKESEKLLKANEKNIISGSSLKNKPNKDLKKQVYLLNLRSRKLQSFFLNITDGQSKYKLGINKIKPKYIIASNKPFRPLKKRVWFKSYKRLLINVRLIPRIWARFGSIGKYIYLKNRSRFSHYHFKSQSSSASRLNKKNILQFNSKSNLGLASKNLNKKHLNVKLAKPNASAKTLNLNHLNTELAKPNASAKPFDNIDKTLNENLVKSNGSAEKLNKKLELAIEHNLKIVDKNPNFFNTLLKLKRLSAERLNKFNKPGFTLENIARAKASFTFKVILNKSKSFSKKNLSNINSNYIRYLDIKERKSSLNIIQKKTPNLTRELPKIYLFKLKNYDYNNLYNKKNIQNYKKLNNITKNSIYKLITNKLLSLNKNNALPIVKNYYNNFNKYKLYKLSSAQKENQNFALASKSQSSKLNEQYNSKSFKTSINKINLLTSNKMPTMSMHKLKELYKLFTLYNNKTNLHLASSTPKFVSNNTFKSNVKSLNPSLTLAPNTMSSNLLINTYKLLNKHFGVIIKADDKSLIKHSPTYKKYLIWKKKKLEQGQASLNRGPSLKNNNRFLALNNKKTVLASSNLLNKSLNLVSRNKKQLKDRASLKNEYHYFKLKKSQNLDKKYKKLGLVSKSGKTVNNLYLKALLTFKRKSHLKKMTDNVRTNIISNANNIRILTHFKKIDQFINIYLKNYNVLKSNNLLENSLKSNTLDSNHNSLLPNKELALNISVSHLRNTYKLKLVKLIFQHELIYLNYIKLLSFNNAIFKNWFVHNLKNTISKIYNKNVILNIVNLKYIHLNSDILFNAIKIKLNKFRKNRVKRVLKLIINKIKIININRQFFNLNNNEYKNVLLHYNNYKTLNTDIFKDLNTDNLSNNENNNSSASLKNKSNASAKKLIYYKRPSKLKALSAIQYNTINFTKYKSVTGVRVQASGRLTKRSTAARSVLSLRYAGSLRNNSLINNYKPSILLKGRISNLQFTKISSKTRNGSFGVKGWISSN